MRVLLVALLLCACTPKQAPRDPRFLTLGQLAEDLSNDPKTFDAIIDTLGTNIGTLGTAQKVALQTMFKNKDWTGLDKQPETTLDTLKSGLDLLAEHRQGTVVKQIEATINASTAELGIPTGKPGPEGEPFVKELGLGLKFGERVSPEKRARFTDSERLAQILNRLSAQDGFTVDGFNTAPELVASLQKDHQVVVVDERLAANFGDLERNGTPIATPLWVSTGKTLQDGTVLALPVPHAQLKLTIRGPRVNTDVTLYPALDLTGEGGGGTLFRADLTGDHP
jgi:hypothetical protein